MTTALQAAKAFNKAHPPIVTLERINQPGCPHHAICEDCGQEAGEHVRSLGSRKVRCLTPEEQRRERDRIDQNQPND